jgi:hypothetical protein
MKQLLNTLYVMTQGAYVSLDHETVKIEVDVKNSREVLLRSARESDDVPDTEALHRAAERLAGPEIHLRMSGHRCSIRAIETWFAQDDQER